MTATIVGWLYRVALIAFPRQLRAVYGEEMMAAFRDTYARRRRLGAAPARRYALRAWTDAIRAGFGSRLGGPGVGGGARGPLGRWGGAARDCVWLEVGADVRQAVRSLRATPGFTLTAIAVLALGVGVNGALFTAVRAALLDRAPFAESDRLVMLDLLTTSTEHDGPAAEFAWSYPKFRILQEWPDLAADPVAAMARRTFTLTGAGDPRRVNAEVVTASYLDVLGVVPVRGAGFDRDDSRGEVVLAHHVWRDRFGSRAVIGETVRLSGEPVTVVGVAPIGFRGLTGRAEMWISMDSVPAVLSPRLLDNFDGHWLVAVGRLRAGATVSELRAQMEAVGAAVHDGFEWTDPTTRQVGGLRTLEEARRNPRAQRAVVVIGGAALLVLLIACANLAALMIARGRARQTEVAVRRALGGSRWRIARALVVETLLLALVAGAVGLGVVAVATEGMAIAWPANFVDGSWNVSFVDGSEFRVDLGTVGFTFGLALAAGLLFSLLPILRLARHDLADTMREGRTTTGSGRLGRQALVAAEIAIALVLAVGAGLMITSLRNLVNVDHGFDAEGLLSFTYTLPRGAAAASDPARFHDELFDRIRRLPGVTAATYDCGAPLDGHCWITSVKRAGESRWAEGRRPSIGVHIVDEHHFDALGVELVSGRGFEPHEGADTAAVAVINRQAARELFSGEEPIGQPISVGIGLTEGESTARIIGVVGDVLYNAPAAGTMAELYVLNRQEPNPGVVGMVRADGDALALVGAVRAELAELDPDLPLFGVATVVALGAARVGDTTAVTTLLGIFAALALLLAATGVWGVVANAVTGRSREMGIRVAVGARPAQMVALALREGAMSATVGALVGALGALALSRLLTALLHEVGVTDATSFGGSALLLVGVSLVASWLPARRAARLDPVRTLRAD